MTVRLPKGVKKAGAQAKKTQSGKAGVVGPPKPVAKKRTPQAKKITTLRGKVQDFRSLYGPLSGATPGLGTAKNKGDMVAPWENYGTLPGTSVLKLGGEDEKPSGGGKRKKKAKQTKRRKRAETGRSKAGTRRKY